MATVPVVTNRSVLPSDNGLPYSNPDAGYASSRALNRSLLQAGAQIQEGTDYLTEAMNKLQLEDDKREFRKLDTEYSAYVRNLTYGDGTPENPGFMNQRGENAIAAYPKADAALKAKQAELIKMASNARVKDMFSTTANDRYDSTMSNFLNHTADERTKANDAVSKARQTEAIMDAASNYAHPDIVERNIAILQGEAADEAKRNGYSPEVAATAFKQARDALLDRTITAAAIGSPGYAQKMLTQYSAEMDGATVAALQEKIHSQVMQRVSDQERFNAIADRNKAREENAAFKDRYSKFLHGQYSMTDLVDDSKTVLDPNDAEFLRSRMVKQEKVTGDDLLFNRRKMQIATGEITDLAQIQNDDLSDKMMDNLTDRLVSNRGEDPVLTSYADKQAVQDIKVKITGPITLDQKFYDPAGPERAANAYDTYVTLRHKGQTTQQALDYVIKQFRPRDVPLSTLAKPSQWTGQSWGDTGNKDAFYNNIVSTIEATKKAYHDNNISEQQFNLEMEELKYLNDVLNNLSDDVEPVIQGNQ